MVVELNFVFMGDLFAPRANVMLRISPIVKRNVIKNKGFRQVALLCCPVAFILPKRLKHNIWSREVFNAKSLHSLGFNFRRPAYYSTKGPHDYLWLFSC